MRADWILPDDKKLEVTLKILNMDKHLSVSEYNKLDFRAELTISNFFFRCDFFVFILGIYEISRKVERSLFT